MKENLVMLYSGGADSRLMLELAFETGKIPYCVLIDYGQAHIAELKFAEAQLMNKNVNYQTVEIKDLNINSGLTGNKEQGTYKGVHSMHVPSRNLIFIGIATAIAESLGIDTIWYGADWSDYLNEFPDCKQEWVGRMNKVLEINGSSKIKLEAPLVGLSKENIIQILLKTFNVQKSDLFSGYGEITC